MLCYRFLWIMGVALTVSFHNKLRHAVPRRHLIFHILQRSFVLILFGVVLNSHGNPTTLDKLRLPGVLQRIGVTYLIVGLLEAAFTKRTEGVNEVCQILIVTMKKNTFIHSVFDSTLVYRFYKIL